MLCYLTEPHILDIFQNEKVKIFAVDCLFNLLCLAFNLPF